MEYDFIFDQTKDGRRLKWLPICDEFSPEFVALAVQDWIARRGFKTLYINPGAPWQNAYSESFNSRFRDEFLNREAFASVLEAKVLGKQHRHWHNLKIC